MGHPVLCWEVGGDSGYEIGLAGDDSDLGGIELEKD
jgi:hypothetical protein